MVINMDPEIDLQKVLKDVRDAASLNALRGKYVSSVAHIVTADTLARAQRGAIIEYSDSINMSDPQNPIVFRPANDELPDDDAPAGP